jgi:hypothetical protein
MTVKGTILGLAVLALVLAGVFWARGRGPTGNTASGDSATVRRAPDATAEAAMPDVTLTDAAADVGDVRIVLSVAPRPPVAFQKHRFRVRVESVPGSPAAGTSGGTPVALEGGRVSFEMTMPMGEHRYSLVLGDDGWQEAEVVLPMCPSGKRRWYATVEGTAAGRPRLAVFRLDLAPPGAAPAP